MISCSAKITVPMNITHAIVGLNWYKNRPNRPRNTIDIISVNSLKYLTFFMSNPFSLSRITQPSPKNKLTGDCIFLVIIIGYLIDGIFEWLFHYYSPYFKMFHEFLPYAFRCILSWNFGRIW